MKRALVIWILTAVAVMAQSTVTGSKTMQGSWDASGASATKPAKSGTTTPSTCAAGEFFFNTAAAAGQNLYLCNPANTWTQAVSGQLSAAGGDLSGTLTAATVKGIQGKTVSATAPTSGQVLTWNGSQWVPQAVSGALGGDLSGTTAAATVQAIQGQSVATTTPATGQVLTWGGSSWGAQTPTGSGGGGSVTERVLVFDGSTTIAGETMTSWVVRQRLGLFMLHYLDRSLGRLSCARPDLERWRQRPSRGRRQQRRGRWRWRVLGRAVRGYARRHRHGNGRKRRPRRRNFTVVQRWRQFRLCTLRGRSRRIGRSQHGHCGVGWVSARFRTMGLDGFSARVY